MPERLRGFRDFYPEEQEVRRWIFDVMKDECRKFGFREVDGPSLESVELYAHKSGEEIMQQMFNFVDKGGREVTLVPEFTPTLARMVASRKDLIKPLKWYTLAKFWRYEEPQSGRYREFYQLNADILGTDTPFADSEILNLSGTIMVSLGLKNKTKIKVNSRTLIDEIASSLSINKKEDLYYLLDRWNKISQDERDRFIENMKVDKGIIDDLISGKILNELQGKSSNLERIQYIMDVVKGYDTIPVELDLKIVRGLAYYTSTVFEIWDSDEKMRAIMGGGRYDKIIAQLNGEFTPAVGFGMGDAVIENLLKREGLWEEKPEKRIFIAVADDSGRNYAISISKILRNNGINVDLNVSQRGMGKQIEFAAKLGYKYALILGDREAKEGNVSIKDLITGEQKVIKLNEAISLVENT